jgi:hypothetical protein
MTSSPKGATLTHAHVGRLEHENDVVTIPRPVPLGRKKGVQSLNVSGVPVCVRFNESDLPLLTDMAVACGLQRGAFIRWCALYVAQELHRQQTGETVSVIP